MFLVCGLSSSLLSLSMTHDRLPDYKPLPDIFLDTFPNQPWGLDVSEYIIIISTWTAAVVILFHKHRYEHFLNKKCECSRESVG